jgi:hypothetical protein
VETFGECRPKSTAKVERTVQWIGDFLEAITLSELPHLRNVRSFLVENEQIEFRVGRCKYYKAHYLLNFFLQITCSGGSVKVSTNALYRERKEKFNEDVFANLAYLHGSYR